MGLLDDSLKASQIGNIAGWALSFHRESAGVIDTGASALFVRSDDYGASLSATLPAGLGGGSYEFSIQGLTDEDYTKIAQGSEGPSVVRLYLYWRDANSTVAGYLANLAGIGDLLAGPSVDELGDALVSELHIKAVTRRAGELRYETVIKAQERVFWQLSHTRPPESINSATISAAATALAEQAQIPIVLHGFEGGELPASSSEHAGDEQTWVQSGESADRAFGHLAAAVEEATRKGGRGIAVIRNGTLHFGVRPIPLEGEEKTLLVANGLIEAKAKENEEGTESSRRRFELTLKGRGDIKPGDLVRFDAPPEEFPVTTPALGAALLGAFGGSILPAQEEPFANETHLYVDSVKHTLSPGAAFSTIVTGTVIEDLAAAWDEPDEATAGAERPATGRGDGRSADPAGRAAAAVRRLVDRVVAERRHAAIAEVRACHAENADSGEPPAQTTRVFRGLAAGDGRPHQARRLEINRDTPTAIDGVAYLTPFAWGKCGLVLPRYPGTRVLLLHRDGRDNDPVDAGALWTSGQGPTSEPGDYWLILPAEVEDGARASIDDAAAPEAYTGKVSQDLIDPRGDRVIEVGSLTIRFGAGNLRAAGEKPTPGTDPVTIEHEDGKARITIDQDGNITLESAASINIRAADGDLNLTAKTINIEADDVVVSVANSMDVS